MPSLESLQKNSRLTKWFPLILFFLAALVFQGVMACKLVNMDDPEYVSFTPVHAGLTFDTINWAFTNHFYAGYFIPVTWLSYALDVTLMGNKAEAFHLTNLLFHAANCVLVYVLINRFTPDKWRAFAVAALWALHPLRVESVAWITERKDVLSTFFGLLAMLSYLQFVHAQRRGKLWFYLLTILTFVLSLLAKPLLTPLPVVLLLMDWWPLGRLQRGSFIKVLIDKIPFFAISFAAGLITMQAQRDVGAFTSMEILSVGVRIQTVFCSYGYYLLKTVLPTDLAPFIVHPLKWPPEQIFGSAIGIFALTAVFVWLWKRDRKCAGPLFGWLWFVIFLFPTSGVMQAGTQPYADRFTYFPAIGLMLALAMAIPANWQRQLNVSRIIIGVLLAAIAIEGVLTAQQIPIWRDGGTLWPQTLRMSPNNLVARENYAAYLETDGKNPQAAIEQCKWVIDHSPNETSAWFNWGIALETQGYFAEALEKYARADALVSSPVTKRAIQRTQEELQAEQKTSRNIKF